MSNTIKSLRLELNSDERAFCCYNKGTDVIAYKIVPENAEKWRSHEVNGKLLTKILSPVFHDHLKDEIHNSLHLA